MPKLSVQRSTIVDEFELAKILKSVKDDDQLLFCVAIAWETGARISEILDLRPKDFSEEGDFWVCSLYTAKQRVKVHGQRPKRILKIKKDNIYRKIIRPIIQERIDMDRRICTSTKDYLGKKLRQRYDNVYFHWLRHSRATIWSRVMDIFLLQ